MPKFLPSAKYLEDAGVTIGADSAHGALLAGNNAPGASQRALAGAGVLR